MKWISKAELKLLKHISKLEGQLASANYALSLLRNGNDQQFLPPRGSRRAVGGGLAVVENQSKGIPLFS